MESTQTHNDTVGETKKTTLVNNCGIVLNTKNVCSLQQFISETLDLFW